VGLLNWAKQARTISAADLGGSYIRLGRFRKVGEQKKQLKARAREKRREALRLRKTPMDARKALMNAQALLLKTETSSAAAESEEANLLDSIAKLEERSSRMLQREMQALGELDTIDGEQESPWPSLSSSRQAFLQLSR
jgi:hypothetical protein